mmetsp:Transcript_96403/g.267937  ORF Transcript_96403/g.267937 Transcript_96403/m.267937 type:complete len:444 (-) Transcript_96403:2455-3786(-)
MVDVGKHDGQRRAAALGTPRLGQEALVEMTPVVHAGQAVDEGELAQQVGLVLEHQLGPHARADHRGIERFGDEVGGAGVQPARLVVRVVLGGDEDHRDRPQQRVGLQFGAEFMAVHAGHLHVEQHQVGLAVATELQCACAVGGHQHLAVAREHPVQGLDVGGLVVDQQQARSAPGHGLAAQRRRHHAAAASVPSSSWQSSAARSKSRAAMAWSRASACGCGRPGRSAAWQSRASRSAPSSRSIRRCNCTARLPSGVGGAAPAADGAGDTARRPTGAAWRPLSLAARRSSAARSAWRRSRKRRCQSWSGAVACSPSAASAARSWAPSIAARPRKPCRLRAAALPPSTRAWASRRSCSCSAASVRSNSSTRPDMRARASASAMPARPASASTAAGSTGCVGGGSSPRGSPQRRLSTATRVSGSKGLPMCSSMPASRLAATSASSA